VGEALRFFKLGPDALTVFYDELDLAPGKVRVKRGGGSGGHNGIRSLDAHCGPDYRRVRIGIGHPGVKELVTPHVLGDFAKADQAWLAPLSTPSPIMLRFWPGATRPAS
jgi:PTH1 family peptidyl-tRNA hydrolase